ncbi:hypothetical protein JYK02_21860 [Corallococcus macrosporus]|uniref:Lipoprotein n=1 Tax=Corallococcus macrosporus TaxID=35 RepID=A0ABS3DFR2_9BACT|nr:hypothetical protein [Corallococcus macrosporus]MBN8230162.1 hypothetical protein [Corallococcus macrosporus]
MRMQSWWSVAVVGCLMGCGGAQEGDAPESPVEAGAAQVAPLPETVAADPSGEAAGGDAAPAPAAACAPGVAREVKPLFPSDRVPGSPLSLEPIPLNRTDVAGTLYFTLDDGSGDALWRSDGTDAGTLRLTPAPGTGASIHHLMAAGARLYFEVYSPDSGSQVWRSDGTVAGTQPARELPACADHLAVSGFRALGTGVSFFNAPCATGGVELWRTDGTGAGTVRLKDFGSAATLVGEEHTATGRLFFLQDGTGLQLWRTDGTEGGTVRTHVFGAQARLARMFKVGDAAVFVVQDPETGTRLWSTDGSADGTRRLKQLDASATVALSEAHVVDATAVFALVNDGPGATEVWKTDGTQAGTAKLGAFAKEGKLLGIAGTSAVMLSRTENGKHLVLRGLALSGGGRTFMATLDNPYAHLEGGVLDEEVARAGGKILLKQAIYVHGPAPVEVSLWVTDGTTDGTRKLSAKLSTQDEYGSPLYATGTGTVFFTSWTPDVGYGPWVTDGTLEGTRAVPNGSPGKPARAVGFQRVGDRVFFAGFPGAPGYSLWSAPVDPFCSATPTPDPAS